MRVIIQPYAISISARAITNAIKDLGIYERVFRIKKEGQSNYRPREDDVIINWGSQAQRFDQKHYINQPSLVRYASDKVMAFKMMQGRVSTPDFTEYQHDAEEWQRQGHTVYARTTASGHSGRGIEIRTPDQALPDVPLYTKKVNVDDEYRIHVAKLGENDYVVFDQQQKKRKSRDDGQVANMDIRNHSNGWIFARHNLLVPHRVQHEAMEALKATGLDFGGVDVGWSREDNRAYVYEINTACGVEGSTVGCYANVLSKMIERKSNEIQRG